MKFIIAALLILFASFADIFLFRVGIIPVQPSYFLIPVFIVICAIRYSIKDIFDLFRSHSSKFFFVIILFSIIYSAFSPASQDVIITELVLNVLTLIIYIFTVHFFRSEDAKLGFIVLFVSFVVLSGSLFYDFFIGLPKFSINLEQMARKGGFGDNPNRAASALKFLALCVLVYLQHSNVKRTFFIFAMVVSVFLTFSRGGIISVILIIILGTANNWNSGIQINPSQLFKSVFKLVFVFAGLFLILNILSVVIKENVPAFTRGSAGERLDMFTGQTQNSSTIQEVSSSEARGELVFKYVDLFVKNPLGYGTGFTTDQRFNALNTHNQFLFFAVNFGFLALIIYLYYFWYGLRLSFKSNHFYVLIFIILLFFEGFITHQFFFNRPIIISLAFFDSLIYKKLIDKST